MANPHLVTLEPDSEEYAAVRCTLSNSTQSFGTVSGVVIQKVDCPEVYKRFERVCRKKLKVTGWCNIHALGSENDAENISKRGFVLNKGVGGFEFRVGVVTESLVPKLMDPHVEHTLLYSDIAIGRSYVNDKKLHEQTLPQGYDSFYVPPKPLDRDGDGHFDIFEYQQAASFDSRDPSEYEHKYFVKDPIQVLPKYVIKFHFLGHTAKPLKIVTHKGKSAEGRTPQEADESSMDEYAFFDPYAHRPVKLRDKLTAFASQTVLVTVEEAYRQALSDFQSEDRLIEGKKQWLEGQLDVIEAKVRQVNVNYAEVVEQVEEAAAAAKKELEQLTHDKLEALLSAEIEIRRQKEHLAWMDGILQKTAHVCSAKIEKALSAPRGGSAGAEESKTKQSAVENSRAVNASQLSFLESWKHATQVRNNAVRVKPIDHIDAIRDVTPNIRIKTNFEIYQSTSSIEKNTADKHGNRIGAPRGPLADTLDAVEDSAYFTEAEEFAKRESVHPLLSPVLDLETEKIQSALRHLISHPEAQALPRVIHKPIKSRNDYSIPLLVDLLGPDGNASAMMNLQEIRSKKSDVIDKGPSALKSMYYSQLDKLLGKAPPLARDSAVEDEKRDKEKMMKLKAVKDRAAKAEAARKKVLERNKKEELDLKKQEEDIAEQKARTKFQEQQEAMRLSKLAWSASKTSVSESAVLDPSLKSAQTMTATPAVSKGTILGAHESGDVADSVPTQRLQQGSRYSPEALKEAVKMYTGAMGVSSLSYTGEKRRAKIYASIYEKESKKMIARLARSSMLNEVEAENLYFSVPFFSTPPTIERLYSMSQQANGVGQGDHGTEDFSLTKMYEMCLQNAFPSIILIRTAEFVFGAYLTHPLRVTKEANWQGTPSCFIFSITVDSKFPFHGRAPARESQSNAGGARSSSSASFLCEHKQLSIGNGDIIIRDGGMGTSNLEMCYGLGFSVNSPEAQCMLAGVSEYRVDDLEVWALQSGRDLAA